MISLPLRQITWFMLGVGAMTASQCLGATLVSATSGAFHLLTATHLAAAPYQGFGVNTGGDGGEVYTVTSLADSGAGTLRTGVVQRNFSGGNPVPRKIVFAVAGNITLNSTLEINVGSLTIDGSAAPAPGITIRKANSAVKTFLHNVSNVVMTHLRFVGTNAPAGGDNLSLQGAQRIMIDHITSNSADDAAIGIRGGNFDVTVSWCLIHGNQRAIILTNGPNGRISLHHNVLANNTQGVPELRYENQTVDIVNNVIAHWTVSGTGIVVHAVEAGAGFGNGASDANIVNNVFAPYSLLVYGSYGSQDDGGPEYSYVQGFVWTATEGSLMGQLYVRGNKFTWDNVEHYSTVTDKLPIPVSAQVTTYVSDELKTVVVPYVGMVHHSLADRNLLNLLFLELGGRVSADLNSDGTLDVNDVDFMRACRTRAGVPQTNPGCASADFDRDGDVDQSDFGALQLGLYSQDYLSLLNETAPVIVQGQVTTLIVTQNTSTTFELMATSGQSGPSLNWQIDSPPQVGSAQILSGSPSAAGTPVTLRYDPATNYTGQDTFIVKIDDGQNPVDNITVQVIVSEPHQAGVYYVDTNSANASDTNSGTQTLPFKTIQRGAIAAQPGDTVFIKSGTYTVIGSQATPVLLMNKSGTAGAPITFSAFVQPNGQYDPVILDGRNGSTQTLVLIRGSYVNIEGLELTNALRCAVVVADDNQNGVVDAHHVNVRFCYAHHNNYEASFIGGAFRTVGPVEHVVFEDCMSHDNSIGFEFRESPTQTSGSMSVPPIAGNIGHTVNMPESQWDSWPGWVGYAARYCTIRRCIAYDNRLNDENSDGFECRYAIECIIEENVSFGNGDDNYDMAGATRCTVRRNIGFNANPLNTVNGDGNGLKIGVRGGLDNLAHNNILFNNPRAGLDMADTERAKVYNNTCYNNGWFGIWFEADRATTGGANVLNNICKTNANGDIGKSSVSRMTQFNYNCVADANNHNWAIPPGTNGLKSTNPLFANESLVVSTVFPAGLTIPQKVAFIRNQVTSKLSLTAGSPCVNSAQAVPGITGTILGSGPDRGALESH